ncbi:MAG: RNA methyltransferase [Prevotellaceae bacterium]|jgi:TrmH family RNA methyltransferase|nr:RNA methyltransferase [Prevotellaceae bacterium]
MPSKALIQKVSSLSHKKFRDELGLFVAEGDKLVEELINSSFLVQHLFVTQSSALKDYNHPGKELVDEKDMKRLSRLKTPSPSLAIVKIPDQKLNTEALKHQLSIVLDGIQDPGNLGTIIRLADWFGINTVICSTDTVDCYNPKVVQATMGAITRVSIHYYSLTELLPALPHDIPIYGTFLNGSNIYSTTLSPYGMLVMGNEGNGISKEVETLIQHRLHIPPFVRNEKGSESLNAAIATAICCSEFRRR